jgi:hypothetical protein
MPEENGSLAIPTSVAVEPGAGELLRVWMSESGMTVVLRTDTLPAAAWGLILIDVAKHAAAQYGRQGDTSSQDAFREIVHMFSAELQEPTDSIRPGM